MAEKSEKKECKFKQSEGTFRLRGIIVGKDNPTKHNGYREGTIEKGKSEGKAYRSIRFLLKTRPDNIVPVELYGMEKDFVNFYNKKEKKNIKMDWAKKDDDPPTGYELIIPEYDMVEKINTEFSDGDSVVIIGKPQYTTYENNGIEVRQTKYNIGRIYKTTEPVDFEAENFEEQNNFTQEIIINAIEEDKKENRLIIDTYVVGYGDVFYPAAFEVDTTINPLFVKNIKTLKLGDALTITGKIHYSTKKETVVGEWGEQVINNTKICMEIIGVDKDSIEKKKYKEKDFILPETKSSKDDDNVDWSNVKEKVNNNELPFDLD